MSNLVTGLGKQLLQLNAFGTFPNPCQLVSAMVLGMFQQLSGLPQLYTLVQDSYYVLLL